MSQSRKRRGRDSERIVQRFWLPWFPRARVVPASLPGADLTGTGRFAVEVKARNRLDIGAWMKQAASRPGLPVLIIRLNMTGESSVSCWPVVIPHWLFMRLAHEAGYTEGDGPCEATEGI